MIYPSIDKILTKVDSKYMLVHVISQRSKQMLEHNHFQLKEKDYAIFIFFAFFNIMIFCF